MAGQVAALGGDEGVAAAALEAARHDRVLQRERVGLRRDARHEVRLDGGEPPSERRRVAPDRDVDDLEVRVRVVVHAAAAHVRLVVGDRRVLHQPAAFADGVEAAAVAAVLGILRVRRPLRRVARDQRAAHHERAVGGVREAASVCRRVLANRGVEHRELAARRVVDAAAVHVGRPVVADHHSLESDLGAAVLDATAVHQRRVALHDDVAHVDLAVVVDGDPAALGRTGVLGDRAARDLDRAALRVYATAARVVALQAGHARAVPREGRVAHDLRALARREEAAALAVGGVAADGGAGHQEARPVADLDAAAGVRLRLVVLLLHVGDDQLAVAAAVDRAGGGPGNVLQELGVGDRDLAAQPDRAGRPVGGVRARVRVGEVLLEGGPVDRDAAAVRVDGAAVGLGDVVLEEGVDHLERAVALDVDPRAVGRREVASDERVDQAYRPGALELALPDDRAVLRLVYARPRGGR